MAPTDRDDDTVASDDDQDEDSGSIEEGGSHASDTIEPVWVESGPGDGSGTRTDDWVRANSRAPAHDGRALTRTTFYPQDVNSWGPGVKARKRHQRTSWEKLAVINDGAYARDISRGGRNFSADKRRWAQTFASQVGATRYQQTELIRLVDDLELEAYRVARYSAEQVIMGLLSLLIDRDIRASATGANDALSRRAVERESFQGLLEDLDMSRKDLKKIRKRIRDTHRDEVLGSP